MLSKQNNNELRVCVVGAGISGLPSIRWCLAEGFDVTCFEATEDLGGLWNYRPQLEQEHSTVMKSTIINTSKEMMTFSDFVPSADYPNFMHNTKVVEWLRQYADEHKLLRHVHFGHKVTKVTPSEDFEESGAWTVVTEPGGTHRFDAVFVCNGHHAKPNWPRFEGLDTFQGSVMHAQTYKEPSAFHDKRVLVVGIGNSAMDISVELSRVSKQVYLSTRRGAWIWARVGANGYPYDALALTRSNMHKFNMLPGEVVNGYFEKMVSKKLDHEKYGVKPQHRFFGQHPTINDSLPNCLCSGTIMLKGDVSRFTPTGVVFEDGTEMELDAVVLCTGYNLGYPFIDPPSLMPVVDNQVDLYKWVFPPNLTHPTLAVIGNIQPYGSISPISEMQARLACAVWAGHVKLPDRESMVADIKLKRRQMGERYVASKRHTVQVDYVEYMDELASLVGCSPPMVQLLFTDPLLWSKLMFGPNLPYVYRLTGRHQWPQARQAICDAWQRIEKPMRNRDTGMPAENVPLLALKFVGALAVMLAIGFPLFSATAGTPLAFGVVSLLFMIALLGYTFLVNIYFDLCALVA